MNTIKFYGLLILVLVSGCNEIKFTQPLPLHQNALAFVPTELRGTFTGIDLGNDTLFIDSLQLRLSSGGKIYQIGKDLVIKKQNEKFFINVKQDYWELGIATHLTDETWQLESFAFDPERPGTFIRELKKIVPLKELESGDLVADPNKRQFEEILRTVPLYSCLLEKQSTIKPAAK